MSELYKSSSTDLRKPAITRYEGGKRVLEGHGNLDPSKPSITVITVVFNGASTLENTICSVIGQNYENFEYLIIDGGSNDGTLEIIKRYDAKIDYWVSEPDNGIYDAMNKGIALAHGDYIGLLNSDDFFADMQVMDEIAKTFQRHNTDIVFSCLDIVDRRVEEKVLRRYRTAMFRPGLMRVGMVPPHPTLYCKRSVYERIGQYKTDYRVSADFEMMVRMFIVAKASWFFLDRTTVKMRAGGISNNGLTGKIHQNMEIVRACRENGVYTNIFLISLKLPFRILQMINARMMKLAHG